MKLNFTILSLLLNCTFLFCTAQNVINKSPQETQVYLDQSIEGLDEYIEDSELEQGVFHLFAHGKPGKLFIDNKWLSQNEIIDFLKPYLIDEMGANKYSHINIYACNFGKGKKGLQAIDAIQSFYGGSVITSNNKVGNTKMGGDWEMEVVLGSQKNVLAFPTWSGKLQVTFSYTTNYTNPSLLANFNCAGFVTMHSSSVSTPLTITFACPITTVDIPVISLGNSNVETYSFDAVGVPETISTSCMYVDIVGNTATNNTGSAGTSGVNFYLTVSSTTPFTQVTVTKVSGTYLMGIMNTVSGYWADPCIAVCTNTGVDVQSVCDSLLWTDGNTYTSPNTSATDTFLNAAGCDSVVTLNLTFNNPDSTFASATSCLIADTGVVSSSFLNVSNCDSIHTVTTTLTLPDSTFAMNASCLIADTGMISNTYLNVFNCDSIHTITTTLLLPDSIFTMVTSCLPADTGTTNSSFLNINGCDSIYTLSTTLALPDSTFASATSCLISDTGFVTSLSSNINGCDSSHTIHTTFLASSNVIDVITACDSHTWIDGITYTSSNNSAFVSLTNVVGCDSVVVLDLTINNSGTPGLIPDSIAVCESFNIEINMQAQNMISYQWQFDDGSGFVNLNESGIYSGTQNNTLTISPPNESLTGNIYRILMSDNCGTIYSDETYLSVSEPHDVLNPIADIQKCLRDSSLIFIDYNGYNYEWDNGQTGPYLTANSTGNYIVNFIENITNCKMEDEISIVVEDCIENCIVAMPSGFSPEASTGVNDEFKALTSCEEGFSFFEFKVFNRWGELIYLSNNPNEGWDGLYKGVSVQMGVYTYSIDYTKNMTSKKENISGNVTLIR